MKTYLTILGLTIGLFVGPSSGATVDRTAEVSQLISKWTAQWNLHDARELGQLLDSKVDFILVSGIHLQGRQAFIDAHTKQFTGRYARSVFNTISPAEVSFIADNIAIVLWRWQITGVLQEDDSPSPDYHGIFTWIVLKGKDGWHIRSAQNTIDKE